MSKIDEIDVLEEEKGLSSTDLRERFKVKDKKEDVEEEVKIEEVEEQEEEVKVEEVKLEEVEVEKVEDEETQPLIKDNQTKYKFAGGTNPDYALDVDDETFYNRWNEDLKTDTPFMGNFWTKDGKLTKNHINDPENNLVRYNNKIVDRDTLKRFQKIDQRKQLNPIVSPSEISQPPENLSEMITNIKGENQNQYDKTLSEDEIAQAKKDNKELTTFKGWRGADGRELTAEEIRQGGEGNVFVNETRLVDPRSSQDIINERNNLLNGLVEKDEFINNEFWKTVVHNNKDNIDTKLKKLQDKYDTFTEDGFKAAMKEYNDYINGLVIDATKTDKNFQDRIAYYEKAVNDQYGNRIRNLQQIEDAKEILPDWAEDSPFLAGLYGLFEITLPQARAGTLAAFQAKDLEAITSEYNQIKDLPDDAVVEGDYEVIPGAMASIKVRKKTTAGEQKKKLVEKQTKIRSALLTRLTRAEEYGEKTQKLSHPEMFDKNFKLDLSFDEVKSMYGTQAGQMILAGITGGGSTFLQETSGIFLDTLREKALEKSGLSEEQFNKLSNKEKSERYIDIIDAGEGDMDNAFVGGGINALMDTASNFFVLGKVAKGLPKNSLKQLFRGQIKQGLKTAGKGTGDVLKSAGAEFLTEIGQEGVSMTTVGVSTDRITNLNDLGRKLTQKQSLKQFAEAGGQALTATFGLSGGGKVIVGGTKEIHTQIAASVDPNHAQNLASKVSAKAIEDFNKIENPTTQQKKDLDDQLAKIDLAVNFVEDTKYKNLKGKPKELVFNNVVTMKDNELKIQDLQTQIKEGTEGILQTVSDQEINQKESEIAIIKEQNTKLNKDNTVELYNQNYAENGKTFAQWINDQTEGDFANKTVTTFKTLKEAKNFFEKKYKNQDTPKDIQSFLDGNDNAINFENKDIYAIDERIRSNIKGGDVTSGNAIHHEILHYMLDGVSNRNLSKMRREIMSNLSNSEDASLIAAANKIKKLKGYKNYTTREGNEEFFTALSDVFAMADAENISLPVNTTLTKIGNAFSGMFTRNTNQGMSGTFQGLTNGGEMLNFIKKYNKVNGKQSVFNTADMPTFGLPASTVTKKSKALVENEINDLGRNVTKAEWDAKKADEAIGQMYGKLDGLVRSKIPANPPPGFSSEDFVSGTIVELIPHIRNFNPEVNDSLSGWINSQLSNKIGNVFRKGTAGTKSVFEEDISEARGIAVDTDEELAPVIKKTTEKVLSKEFNYDLIDNIVADIMLDPNFKIPKDYKSVKDMTPELTAELFGVDPNQYIDPKKSLKKSDVIAARTFIRKNPELLHSLLPENLTQQGKATGVRKLLLDAFYEKTGIRKEAALGRSKQGSEIRIKKPYNNKEFLATFGIIPGQVMKVTNQTQQSGIIKAMMNETGKIMTNQAIRKNLPKIDTMRQAAQNLRDGKSEVMWSRSLVGVEGLDNLVTEAGFIPLDPKKDKAQFRYFMTTEFPKFFPGSVILADSFGPNEKRKGRFFFSKDERGDVLIEAGKNETHGLTPNDVKALKVAWGSKGDTWFNQDLTKGRYKNTAELSARGMELMIRQFRAMLDPKQGGNPANIKYISAIFAGQGQATKHMIRQVALPTGKSLLPTKMIKIGKELKKDKINEHVIPANWMANFILDTIHKNLDPKIVDARINWIKDNYYQLRIKRTDDAKVTEAGFGEILPTEFITELDKAIESGDFSNVPSPLIRYVHPKVNAIRNGFDLNKITYKNQTLAQYYNIDVNGVYINNTTKAIQQQLAYEIETKQITRDQARKYMDSYLNIANEVKKTAKVNATTFSNFLSPDMNIQQQIKTLQNINKALQVARDPKAQEKGITIVDFDQTLAITEEKVLYTMPDGTTDELTALEFAEHSEQLQRDGATFNFSEFKNVKGATKGPFFDIAQQIKGKFGNKDIFVLTARPQAAAVAIQSWLKATGLDIKLENITGLENGTPQAKANYVIDKASQGYNNFLFADDVYANVKAVQNVLDIVDVKRDVQQAKLSRFANIDKEFDKIIEQNTGLDRNATVSIAKAKAKGAKRGNWFRDFFIPPSAEDFTGLLYNFIGKGKKGEADFKFFKDVLIRPFARGIRDLNAAKQVIANEYASLKKTYPDVVKSLRKESNVSGYNNSHAIRVYLWNKNGIPIPGLSKTDETALIKHVKNNTDMKVYADQVSAITKLEDGYTTPSNEWMVGNISTDMLDVSNKIKRSEYLKEWKDNYEKMFTPERLNKIELIYGTKVIDALKDMNYRMEYGTNRSKGQDKITMAWQNWVNNSVGAIMFFNMRSAVLQTISSINFVNWNDNNPFKAAKALANQKQYWKDFSYIFNHPTLKQRRAGLDIDVNAAEIAARVTDSKNPISAGLNYLLQIGFTPTRIADSFAIASGGATFYRNRVNTYLKQGLNKKQAEEKAFLDFQEISEATQQSARPDMISQQQAGPLGRLVLAFQVTPMQYARLMKRSVQDLVAGRGDTKTHISKILYYGAVQNIMFNALQQAAFALAFADDEEDEEDKMTQAQKKKATRVMNGMADSILRGLGVQGAAVATIKNMIIKFLEQEKRGYRADHAYTMIEGLNISPPIGSKARKVYSATQTYKFNRDAIKQMGFDINNPAYEAVGNVVSGTTNVPLDRVVSNINNIRGAMDKNNAAWQRIAMLLGWNRWDVNVPQRELEKVKKDIKKKKAEERKRKKNKK